MLEKTEAWEQAKETAYRENKWFIREFVDLSIENIARNYLQADQLDILIRTYNLPAENPDPKRVGIVMAGNIPLVGFHDFFMRIHYRSPGIYQTILQRPGSNKTPC